MQNPNDKPRRGALTTAFVCGALPMILGTAVFVIWAVTSWGWWERAWMWLIGFAMVCLLVGSVAVARHLAQSQSGSASGAGSRRSAVFAGLLLFLNIPVGVLLMMLLVSVLTRYTVDVANDSDVPVESLVLTGPGVESIEIGPVAPQQRTSKPLRFTGDGKLAYSGLYKGSIHSGILEASASPDAGGGKQLRIMPEGDWVIGPR
ncbi:MAG: hypothetical protein AB9869_22105 [Verrucomicrobiia bacterium]